jgi:hypothetical protein
MRLRAPMLTCRRYSPEFYHGRSNYPRSPRPAERLWFGLSGYLAKRGAEFAPVQAHPVAHTASRVFTIALALAKSIWPA